MTETNLFCGLTIKDVDRFNDLWIDLPFPKSSVKPTHDTTALLKKWENKSFK